MTEHDLKCHPPYFEAVLRGDKPFELRRDDRGYAVGDVLRLREWLPDMYVDALDDGSTREEAAEFAYSGRECRAAVTYALRGEPWLAPGYVALGLRLEGQNAAAEMWMHSHQAASLTLAQRAEEAAELRAALAAAEARADRLRGDVLDGRAREVGLALLVERLAGALREYGEHHEGVGCWRGSLTCTCGLSAALDLVATTTASALAAPASAYLREASHLPRCATVRGAGACDCGLSALRGER